jgi:hypothetical protein
MRSIEQRSQIARTLDKTVPLRPAVTSSLVAIACALAAVTVGLLPASARAVGGQ